MSSIAVSCTSVGTYGGRAHADALKVIVRRVLPKRRRPPPGKRRPDEADTARARARRTRKRRSRVLLATLGASGATADENTAMATIEVSDELRAAATYFGTVGERWLDELPAVVASLEAEWGISTGRTLTGGNFAYVAEVVTAEGQP